MRRGFFSFEGFGITALYIGAAVFALWLVAMIGIHVYSRVQLANNPPSVIVICGEDAELYILNHTLRHLLTEHRTLIRHSIREDIQNTARTSYLSAAEELTHVIDRILQAHFGGY